MTPPAHAPPSPTNRSARPTHRVRSGSICLVVLTVVANAIAAPPPAASASTAPPASNPAVAARLASLGSTGARAHDPSSIVRCKDEYWLFSTGRGVTSFRSRDLRTWERMPRALPIPPRWVREVVPDNRNGEDFWAPDVVELDGRYLLYYSVSSWGKNTSAIALATNGTLHPADPAYRWVDEGVVVRSHPDDDFNAIDPAVTLDAGGKLWLSFGSFWGGIKLVELDRRTGKRVSPDSPVHSLARAREIEAPYIHRHGAHYYLFVNHGLCCRGVKSTYDVRVGRSERITGPYIDRDGKDLRDGGGTVLMATDGPFVGPGHVGIFEEGGVAWITCHFYDATDRGRGTLAVRKLLWDTDGWPMVVATQPAR